MSPEADVIWVPLPFVPLEVVPAVLGTVAAPLRLGLVDVGEVPRSWPAPARLYASRRPIR